MCATLCSLNRCILLAVFYVLPSGIINDDDDDDSSTLVDYRSQSSIIFPFIHYMSDHIGSQDWSHRGGWLQTHSSAPEAK